MIAISSVSMYLPRSGMVVDNKVISGEIRLCYILILTGGSSGRYGL